MMETKLPKSIRATNSLERFTVLIESTIERGVIANGGSDADEREKVAFQRELVEDHRRRWRFWARPSENYLEECSLIAERDMLLDIGDLQYAANIKLKEQFDKAIFENREKGLSLDRMIWINAYEYTPQDIVIDIEWRTDQTDYLFNQDKALNRLVTYILNNVNATRIDYGDKIVDSEPEQPESTASSIGITSEKKKEKDEGRTMDRLDDIALPSQPQPEANTEVEKTIHEDYNTGTRASSPTAKTEARAEVFFNIKKAHPEWTQSQVAMEACDKLGEIVTGDSVRNTYRSMRKAYPHDAKKWIWKRSDRIDKS